MKRWIPLMLLALALSACTVRFDADLVVNEDESGTFALFIGLDDELAQLVAQFAPDVDLADQLGDVEGWTTEEVTQDNFDGVRVSTEFSSFDDLESKLLAFDEAGAGGFGAGALSRFELEHEGDTFTFEANIGGLADELGGVLGDTPVGDFAGAIDTGDLSQLFEAEFRLTMPGNIDEHNADTISGNTLSWQLAFDDEQAVLSAKSTLGSDSAGLFVAGATIVLLAIVGTGVAAIRRRKSDAERQAVEAAGTDQSGPI